MTCSAAPNRDDGRPAAPVAAGSPIAKAACSRPAAGKGPSRAKRAWLILGVLAAATLASSVQPARAADDSDLRRALVGSWGRDAECKNGRVTFRPDGVMVDEDGSPAQGRYAVENGIISTVGGWRGSIRTKDFTGRLTISGDEMAVQVLTVGGENVEQSLKLVRCGPSAGPVR